MAVFTANHLTDTDKENSAGKYKQLAEQNYPGSVASYNARPGDEVGLFYNAPEPKSKH